jgi:hypothetical protein
MTLASQSQSHERSLYVRNSRDRISLGRAVWCFMIPGNQIEPGVMTVLRAALGGIKAVSPGGPSLT